MSATDTSNLTFEPKVYSDYAMAYFDQKLGYGAWAVRNNELMADGSGLTVNFPFYNTVGEVEEPDENESLTVDNLTDSSFSTTVREVGKAIGVKKKAFKKSADMEANIMKEVTRQQR